MKLKSLNKYISLLILFISFQPLHAEEEIDIWNQEIKEKSQIVKPDNNNSNDTINSKAFQKSQRNNNIKIEDEILENSQDIKIFGIYDPAENNFDLNMWTQTEAENVRSSFKRIKKIRLSNTATKLFENTMVVEGTLYVSRGYMGTPMVEDENEDDVLFGEMIRTLLNAGDDDIFQAPQGVSEKALQNLLKQDKESPAGPIEGWDADVFSSYYNVDLDRVIRLYARLMNHTIEQVSESEEDYY